MKCISCVLGLLILISCKDKNPITETPVKKATCTIQPTFGDQNLTLNTSYTLTDGTVIQFTDIKSYFYGLSSNGTNFTSVALFNFADHGTSFFSITDKGQALSGLQFSIGVDATVNHNDPSAFSSTNPLNIAIANDMHWSWNTGYIFTKIEGRADTIQDGIEDFTHVFTYHVGGDNHYNSGLNIPGNWSQISGTLRTLKLKLDMKQFFENVASPINVRNEFITHSDISTESLTIKVKSNFASSISAL